MNDQRKHHLIALIRSKAPSPTLLGRLSSIDLSVVHVPLIQTNFISFQTNLIAIWNIFVSPASVESVRMQAPNLINGAVNLCAVGLQTAAKLYAAGAKRVIVPEVGEGASALLACEELQDVSGKQVQIFCATDGLALLADTLHRRFAHVEKCICYERTARAITQTEREALQRARLVAVSSGSNFLQSQAHYTGNPPGDMRPIVLTPSERVRQMAAQAGFESINCHSSDDEALTQTLLSLRHLW
jgi:uroporphyrinogen-III synthase